MMVKWMKQSTVNNSHLQKINGNLELQELNIQDEVLKEDREMIEDLVISAVNKGITMAQAKSKEKMESVTGGMLSGLNIPGM